MMENKNNSKEHQENMNDKNSNNKGVDKDVKVDKEVKKSLFKRYPVQFILLIALVISIGWGWINASSLENRLTKKYQTLVNDTEVFYAEKVAQTFALAIRTELNYNNQGNAEQYIMQLIREEKIKNIQLIDFKTKNIIVSTNMKEKDSKADLDWAENLSEVSNKIQNGRIFVLAPVMGVSNQMGNLLIEFSLTEVNN